MTQNDSNGNSSSPSHDFRLSAEDILYFINNGPSTASQEGHGHQCYLWSSPMRLGCVRASQTFSLCAIPA